MEIRPGLKYYLSLPIHPIGLAVFRMAFGILMFCSSLRFLLYGWIEKFYIEPVFFFKYYGFEWVSVAPAGLLYGLFGLMMLASLGIAFGYRYRISSILFFALFCYFELLDKTYYLNHYYLVSLIALWMIFLPANRYASLDIYFGRVKSSLIPRYFVLCLQIQIAIVYVYAGFAKIGSDWLLDALPMKIWLRQYSPDSFLGGLLADPITAYFASWFGCIYDLSIVFFLSWNKTRAFAYFTVIAFHIATWLLFPIGVFPFVMIGFTLIFFPNRSFRKLQGLINKIGAALSPEKPSFNIKAFAPFALSLIFLQVAIPLRSLAYPGSVLWHEQGFNFSWKVMRVEKAATALFTVSDPATNRTWEVYNGKHLNAIQEKMMAIQPDFILQYADYLGKHYSETYGFTDPVVKADVFVSINGSKLQRFINPNVNLQPLSDGWKHKSWILDPEE